MSNTNHSIAPWICEAVPGMKSYDIYDAERRIQVATVHGGMVQTETDANCGLIWTAPEMLAALKLIYEWLKYDFEGRPMINAVWIAGLIKKAEGVRLDDKL